MVNIVLHCLVGIIEEELGSNWEGVGIGVFDGIVLGSLWFFGKRV